MLELLTESIALVNLPYTILLVLMLLYWGLYILGAVGADALDFLGIDLDADVDVDVDADVDIDADVGADADVDADVDVEAGSGHAGWLMSTLQFFHAGDVPIVFTLSILILAMWTISVVANHYLGNASVWIALAAFPVVLLGAAMITKALITPLLPVLKSIMSQTEKRVRIVGKTCVITSLEATPEYGRAEIATDGAPIVLNVKTNPGVRLARGDEAVIFEHDKQDNIYLVAKLDLEVEPRTEE